MTVTVWIDFESICSLVCFLFDADREEKRCRVREKELREKDVLIQDNLIRFSSFLSQQDTRKTKDLEAA